MCNRSASSPLEGNDNPEEDRIQRKTGFGRRRERLGESREMQLWCVASHGPILVYFVPGVIFWRRFFEENEPAAQRSRDMEIGSLHHVRTSLAKARMENMEQALRIHPVNGGSVGSQARECLDCLPGSLVCCISFVSAEDLNLLKFKHCFRSDEDPAAVTDRLLMTRLGVASKPVVVLLPVLPLSENPPYVGGSKLLEHSSTPYDLSDDDDNCNHPSDEEKTPLPEVLNQTYKTNNLVLRRVAVDFVSILEESRLSTSRSQPVNTLEEKSIWWKWLMELTEDSLCF